MLMNTLKGKNRGIINLGPESLTITPQNQPTAFREKKYEKKTGKVKQRLELTHGFQAKL